MAFISNWFFIVKGMMEMVRDALGWESALDAADLTDKVRRERDRLDQALGWGPR